MNNITLYFREGNSDKVYQASLTPHTDGFLVEFAYGRRGSTLQTGRKTNQPVSHEAATAIFEKLVKEKTAKGYTAGENAPVYSGVASTNEDTGIRCQLLNAVPESEIERLLGSSLWCAQEKFDGRRVLIRKVGNDITGINRKGLKIGLPGAFHMAALSLPHDFLLDGEAVGEFFHAFDLLEFDGQDLRRDPLRDRLPVLESLLHSSKGDTIRLVPTARLPWEKRGMFEMLQGERREGIVFKQLDAPYTSGRPASGGTQRKIKFVETASFIVGGINSKRSVSLLLLDGNKRVPAGNVTIPPNHPIPAVGEVVEVRYLYALKESGSVYQPVFLGKRDDIELQECTVDQLKFKASIAA